MRIEVEGIAERSARLARKLTDRYEPTEPEATEAPEPSTRPEPIRRAVSALAADAGAQGSPPPPDASALFNAEIRQQAYGRRR